MWKITTKWVTGKGHVRQTLSDVFDISRTRDLLLGRVVLVQLNPVGPIKAYQRSTLVPTQGRTTYGLLHSKRISKPDGEPIEADN